MNPLMLRLATLASTVLPALCMAASTPTQPGDVFLAGGSLGTCSELAPRACRTPMPERPDARTAARFVFDDDGVERALSPRLWEAPDAPSIEEVAALLRHVRPRAGGRAMASSDAADLLEAVCVVPGRHAPRAQRCAPGDARAPWQRMLADERSALLAAFEQPQIEAGLRRVERADPHNSGVQGGTRVLAEFVEAARVRSGRERPVIAYVTASAWDVFEPVDFYQSAFDALGADARWWPIDAALNAAVSNGDCGRLDELRERVLSLPGRARIYPDLVGAQQAACAAAGHLALLPLAVDGVFFAGGDQWRLRRALVDADDAPNAWLHALREANARGVVVGGTSAGAAVQSGGAMLSNGDTGRVLQAGAKAAPPPAPGCARAQRCPPGIDEADLTWWADGGTGLAHEVSVDTHFSERARELRLVALLAASGTATGMGADEASALRVQGGPQWRRVEAIGAAGGWVFVNVEARASGYGADAFYLGAGSSLLREGGSVVLEGDASPGCRDAGALPPASAAPPDDALAGGALRDVARRLAACGLDAMTLAAADGEVRLQRDQRTRVAVRDGHVGIGPLRLEWRASDAR